MSHIFPLFDSVKRFLDHKKKGAFHTPAHHGGHGAPSALKKSWGEAIFQYDLTELETLDNLAHPSGPLLELQKEAAKVFGAGHTFLSVNGATLANQGAMLSFLNPGDKVILQRDLHRSIYNGLILTGAEPVYLPPTIHSGIGLPCSISPEEVERAFLEHPEAKGLILSNPNYFGFVSDLGMIASIVKKRDKILMVDEALGSLFPFSFHLPPSALQVGADLVIHSGHKGLCGLTQTGLLHVSGGKIDPYRVQQNMNLLQSTSPSYLLLLSLEGAIFQIKEEGEALVSRVRELSNKFDDLASGFSKIQRVPTADFTKVLIKTWALGISGFQAEKVLSDEFGVIPEASGYGYLLFFLSLGNTETEMQQLAQALEQLETKWATGVVSPPQVFLPTLPERAINPREAFFYPKEVIPLDQAEGKVAGTFLIPYPPGVPIWVPGERICREHLLYINELLQWGGDILGLSDEKQVEVLLSSPGSSLFIKEQQTKQK